MKKGPLFKLHMITGLVSGIFVFIICLSGSLLVFKNDFNRLAYPSVSSSGTPITLDSAYSSVQQSYPNAQISNGEIPASRNEIFVFSIYDSAYRDGSKPFPVFVHPHTGSAMGFYPNRLYFMNWLARLHNSFHAGKKGEWLLGSVALLFLLSLVSGCILYRRSMLDTILFRKKVFRKGNLHQLIGTWALLFNLMMGVTGFWMQRYVFKSSFYRSDDYKPVLKASPRLSFNFDSSYKQVQKKHPDFTGHVVYFPQSSKGKTAIYGSNRFNSFIHSKKFADAVMLDSAGRIARTAFVNEIDADSRYDIINAQVHYGQYGGWAVKLIYGLLGITGALLSITGFLLWLRRNRSRIADSKTGN